EAETRLGAIGVNTSTVDRLVAARGIGGTDPVVPASPSDGLASSGTTTTIGSADGLAPSVSRYGLSNNPFVVGGRTPTFGVAARTKHKRGTTFRYTLSEAATVKIAIVRGRAGRRKGSKCVAPTRALRRAHKCIRRFAQGTLTRTSHQGVNSVAFSGRIGSKVLRPGGYQATLIATDAARNNSTPKTITFTIANR
ncbi:MAG: hypothetical protein M3159_09110, partial [Actinomycetota bacterium]|nr:hypothetical protein [Actinomycetota bacterium]